jgi:hypothetical protein
VGLFFVTGEAAFAAVRAGLRVPAGFLAVGFAGFAALADAAFAAGLAGFGGGVRVAGLAALPPADPERPPFGFAGAAFFAAMDFFAGAAFFATFEAAVVFAAFAGAAFFAALPVAALALPAPTLPDAAFAARSAARAAALRMSFAELGFLVLRVATLQLLQCLGSERSRVIAQDHSSGNRA